MAFRQVVSTAVATTAVAIAARSWAPPQPAAPATVVVQSAAAPTVAQPAGRDTAWDDGSRDIPASRRARRGSDLVAAFLADAPNLPTSAPPAVCTYVVTLPDPRDSRLDWEFDAGLESVQRGFQAHRLVLDRFWLPWTVDADSTLRKRDWKHEPIGLRRLAPGVLLFRSAASDPARPVTLALAYVVGETPTSGINAPVLQEALRDRDLVRARYAAPNTHAPVCPADSPAPRTDSTTGATTGAAHDTLRVIGPMFSGSLLSLGRELRRWLAADTVRRVSVISGGVSGARNRAQLRAAVGLDSSTPGHQSTGVPTPGGAFADRVDYHTTLNTAGVLLRVLHDRVLRPGGLDVEDGEVAYIVEGSTSFGSGAELAIDSLDHGLDSAARHLIIPFPLSMSRLRAEYARHPEATTSGGAGAQPAPRLPLELQDPAGAVEVPPAFSELTAPAVERALDDIGQTLLAHRIRVVVVAATDVRDRLFIAQAVKTRLRDVQLVLVASHSLYLRPELNPVLRGAYVVSTYPLVFESQYWTPGALRGRAPPRLAFTSEPSEGTYNATVLQLARVNAGADRAMPLDYAIRRSGAGGSPNVACVARPPVWLTVVGRTSMAPVRDYAVDAVDDAALASSPDRDQVAPWRWGADGCAAAAGAAEDAGAELQPTGMTGWERFTLWCAVAAAGFLLWNAARSRDADPHVGAAARPVGAAQIAAMYAGTGRALRTQALAALVALCALAPLRASAHGRGLPADAWGAAVAVGVLTLAVTGWVTAHALRAVARAPHDAVLVRWRCGVATVLGAVFVLNVLAFAFRVLTLGVPRRAEFFARALQFASGVSPLAPIALGCVFVGLWSHVHTQRMALLGPASEYERWQEARGPALHPALLDLPSGRRGPTRLAAVVVLGALFVVWLFGTFARSPESVALGGAVWFDWMHDALVATVLVVTTWTVLHFARTWRAFRGQLRAMADDACFDAYARLPKSLAHFARVGPLPACERARVCERIAREVAPRLRRLEALPAAGDPRWGRPAATGTAADDAADAPVVRGPDGAPRPAVLAAYLADPPRAAPPSAAARAEVRAAAAEVFALLALEYVEWAIRQLRWLAWLALGAVVLSILLVSSYPLAPSGVLHLVLFVVLAGAVTTLVVVLVQANRDATLSAMARTTPDELDWNAPFVLNLIAVLAVPTLTVVSAQFPEVSNFLFSWLAPVLRTVGHG